MAFRPLGAVAEPTVKPAASQETAATLPFELLVPWPLILPAIGSMQQPVQTPYANVRGAEYSERLLHNR